MNYGYTHKVVTFNVDSMSVIKGCINNPTLEWKDATLFDKTKNKERVVSHGYRILSCTP